MDQERGTLSPSFDRHAVATKDQPSEVTVGAQTSFVVSGLDLTSLGSPANTEVTAYVGDIAVGTFSVSNGTATIAFVAPKSIAAGPATLKLVAAPSNTTVTFPVTVNAAASTKPTPPNRPVTPPTAPGPPSTPPGPPATPPGKPTALPGKPAAAPGESVLAATR